MTSAFSPGHITFFFRPVYSDDPLTTGSKGLGMKLSLGAWATVFETDGPGTAVSLNGSPSDAEITSSVARMLAPGRGFDIRIKTDLPVSQGFGMSAAGSIAAGLCICDICGIDSNEAYKAAHMAELLGKGGLGDVAGIMANGPISIRYKAGLPPSGAVIGAGRKRKITIAVLGGKMETKSVLGDPAAVGRVVRAGDDVCGQPLPSPMAKDILRASRLFSSAAGLETPKISEALAKIPEAGMCMLGNSIFAFCSRDKVRDALPDAEIYECRTTDAMPSVIRRA